MNNKDTQNQEEKENQNDLSSPEINTSVINDLQQLQAQNLPGSNQQDANLIQLIKSCEINPNEVIQEPPVLAEVTGDNNSIPFLSLGNFSLVIGKAKSRKTFFLSLLTSNLLGSKGIITSHLGGKTVLYFDTEQSRFDVQKCFKRVCNLLDGTVPSNLHVYCLRKFTPEERLEIIEHCIDISENVGSVLIDGARDLVTSINDEDQATDISSKLLKWTEERNIHIVVVLHQNKGDNNARGHLGAELTNKAETTITISRNEDNKDASIVSFEYCRDKEPKPFAFEITTDGLPEISNEWEPPQSKRKEKKDIADHQIHSMMNEAFTQEPSPKYSELTRQVKEAHRKQIGKSIGDNGAKDIITRAKNLGIIFQEKEKGPYRLKTSV